MFKYIGKTLITGFITILPIVLTIYLLYWIAVASEEVMGNALRNVLHDEIYFPGLGMLVGVVVIFIIGLMMNAYLVRKLFGFSEQLLYRLPFVNLIYRAFRDFFDFLSPDKEGLGQVVAVTLNNMELVGFVTQEDQLRMPPSFRDRGCVLVYLPMSYMIGGYTLLIPRNELRPLQMTREEAMRFVLTAGITGKKMG